MHIERIGRRVLRPLLIGSAIVVFGGASLGANCIPSVVPNPGPGGETPLGADFQAGQTLVNNALGTLTSQSEQWQGQLGNLSQQLIKVGLPTAAGYVDSIAQRAIASAGSEIRCDADFAAARVRSSLRALVQALSSKSQQVTSSDPPTTCKVVPDGISLLQAPAKVDFIGYDYDRTGTQVLLEKINGTRQDVTQFTDRTTHYHWSLNTSANGVTIDHTCQRIVVQFNNTEIGRVGILNDCPTLTPTVIPAESGTVTQQAFNCGDSFLTGCSNDWFMEKPCDPGFQRTGVQALREGSKGNGHCEATWTTSNANDCSAKIHIGLSGGTFGGFYRCQLLVTETKPARTIPPPPAPGWCSR